MNYGIQGTEQIAAVPEEDFSSGVHPREAERTAGALLGSEGRQMIVGADGKDLAVVDLLAMTTDHQQEREALVLSARDWL